MYVLMRRHRHVDGRVALVVHALADRFVIGSVRFEINVVPIGSLDNVILGVATLTDETAGFQADMHIARDELGPILEIGLKNRLIDVGSDEFDYTDGIEVTCTRRNVPPAP